MPVSLLNQKKQPRKQEKKQGKSRTKEQFINEFKSSKYLTEEFAGDRWVDTKQCFISKIKIDRKTKDPQHIAELAESLKGGRQINAVVARKDRERFEIISGECRYDAASINGEKLLVRVVDCSDNEAIGIIIAENEKRKDLSDYDKALSFIEYIQKGYVKSQRELAKNYNLKKSYVGKLLLIKNIPDEVKSVLPMQKMKSDQFESISKLIQSNEMFIDAFVKHADKVNLMAWTDFVVKVTNTVYPKQKKIVERFTIRSKKSDIGSIKPVLKNGVVNGYTVTVSKDIDLDVEQSEQLQKLIEKAVIKVVG